MKKINTVKEFVKERNEALFSLISPIKESRKFTRLTALSMTGTGDKSE